MCCDPMAVFVSHARLSKDVYCHVQRQIENPMLFFLTLLELSMTFFKIQSPQYIYTPAIQPIHLPLTTFPILLPTNRNLSSDKTESNPNQPPTPPINNAKTRPRHQTRLEGPETRLPRNRSAAQREREEQEERERKQHPSREGDDGGAQQRQGPPSTHSNAAGKSRGSRFQDDNAPRESARRGTSVRSIAGDGRHQSQQRRDTRSRASQHRSSHIESQHPSYKGDEGDTRQRQGPPSTHSNAAGKSRGSRFQDDNAPRESARRGTSVRSIAADGGNQFEQRRETGSRAGQHRPSHTGSRTSQFHSRDITGHRFSRDDNKPDISKDGNYSHSSRRATGESYSNDNGGRSRGTASVQGGAESRGSRARMSGRGSGAATIEEYT